MHDIKWIRQHPDAFDAGLARRGLAPHAAQILALDEAKRKSQTELQELQNKRNALAKAVGEAKRKGENADALLAEAKANNDAIAALEARVNGEGELEHLLATLPNIPAADVPDGKDETANKEVRQWGGKLERSFTPKEHFDLGEALGMMDFEGAAKLSGARFVVLKRDLARLERALANFMLDVHTTEFGYTEVSVPLLVRDAAMFGTGQLPKFGEDLFRVSGDFWLIPTAEVPVTNLVADSILKEEELPLRLTAYTPCFRSEAGSAGRDTRGMIRQHQFGKVEIVSITTPEMAVEEHERLTACAEAVLQKLGLHYRVMLLSSGDMGFSSHKTYDIEVWLPGQKAYREISSCSHFAEFQARRMKARYRPNGAKETRFVHTLNGSGLPTGRTLVAILENYQDERGHIAIPEVLKPYMGGLTHIEAVQKSG